MVDLCSRLFEKSSIAYVGDKGSTALHFCKVPVYSSLVCFMNVQLSWNLR